MKPTIKPLTQRPAWKALATHHKQIQKLPLRKLFADDAKRGQRFTAEADGLFLDFSKNCINDKTLKLLLQLADESGLRGKMDAMFSGAKINVTENRAVLHVAFRCAQGDMEHGAHRKAKPFSWTEKMWCRKSTPCSKG
jgi:glucose-6-phosphate isomerase